MHAAACAHWHAKTGQLAEFRSPLSAGLGPVPWLSFAGIHALESGSRGRRRTGPDSHGATVNLSGG